MNTETGPDQPALMSAVPSPDVSMVRPGQQGLWKWKEVSLGVWILCVCTHLTADEIPHHGSKEGVGVSKGPGDTFSSKLNS